jgi:hypothetical protein
MIRRRHRSRSHRRIRRNARPGENQIPTVRIVRRPRANPRRHVRRNAPITATQATAMKQILAAHGYLSNPHRPRHRKRRKHRNPRKRHMHRRKARRNPSTKRNPRRRRRNPSRRTFVFEVKVKGKRMKHVKITSRSSHDAWNAMIRRVGKRDFQRGLVDLAQLIL